MSKTEMILPRTAGMCQASFGAAILHLRYPGLDGLWGGPVFKRITNVSAAVLGGVMVFAAGMAVGVALLPRERTIIVHLLIANSVTALIAVVIAMSIELRHAGRHYRYAAERAAHMAELNHNVRNAVFPLCLVVQRRGDPESDRLAQEAMTRLDIALRDAAVDAYSGKIKYAEKPFGRANAA